MGESELSPGDSSAAFPRMPCIRAGRRKRPGQKHKAVKLGRSFQAAAGNKLFRRTK